MENIHTFFHRVKFLIKNLDYHNKIGTIMSSIVHLFLCLEYPCVTRVGVLSIK